ncbi:hypothetical protein MTR_0001s0480 [Medicago truncatula]|uniref:Uncharacterized protein n=1 Tax=Medicago truncatula TaxID=3880 RepID=A0A072TJN9_MEDTR|nr:hypothetical protein MTR_0001s0480 [Medicago truncatula]
MYMYPVPVGCSCRQGLHYYRWNIYSSWSRMVQLFIGCLSVVGYVRMDVELWTTLVFIAIVLWENAT